jgi:tetratricopeptide (TPR) repeat protein
MLMLPNPHATAEALPSAAKNISNLEIDAVAAEKAGQWDKAVQLRRLIADDAPNHISNYCLLGFALRRTGDFDAANGALRSVLDRFADDISLLQEYAWVAHARCDWEEAAQRWEAVLKLSPDHLNAHCCLVSTLTQARRFDEAEAVAERLRMRHPERLEALSVWAWNAHNRGAWAAASERWWAVLARDPGNMSAACCLVTALTRDGKYDEAETAGEEAAKCFPAHLEVMRTQAWISHKRGDWRLAAERWRRVSDADPEGAEALGCLATTLRALGRFNEAESALVRAMALAPGVLIHQIDYAVTAQEQGDHSEAERRWSGLHARHANDLVATGQIGFHQMQARLRHLDSTDATIPVEATTGALDSVTSHRELFMSMESLGDNCEFGGVQRKFGAEPLGLLRFAGILAANLARALERRLEGIGDPDKVRLEIIQTGEYIIHDDYEIIMHSFVHTHEISHDLFLARILRRVTFLRKKLIADLEEGTKLFVFKDRSGMSLDEAIMLHRAIRTYGNPHLLCVLLADSVHPAGLVEVHEPGLLIGYISRFANAEGLAGCQYDEWLTICAGADELRRSWPRDGRQVPLPPADLMYRFEALGINCEFGGVQRHFGAEPLDLFRFTGIRTEQVVQALNTDLRGIGDPEFTRMTAEGEKREYFTFDTRYHMASHTFVYENEVDRADFLARQCRKIAFLVRKVQDDLAGGEKIFIHRLIDRKIGEIDLQALYQAIRRYGSAALLCVGPPDHEAPVGRVDLVAEGLMVARIVQRVDDNPPGQPDHDLKTWLSVCQQASMMWPGPKVLPRQINEVHMALHTVAGHSTSTQLRSSIVEAFPRIAGSDATENDFYTAVIGLRRVGKIVEAREVLDTLSARFVRSDELRFRLEDARTMAAEGRHEVALALLEELKTKHPTNCHAFLAQAEVLVLIQDYAKAYGVMKSVPLGGLNEPMIDHIVFRGVQLAIYTACMGPLPKFSKPRSSEPCEGAALIMMIRDEADVIGANLLHHYLLGFRKFVFILNRCQDATTSIIKSFGDEHPDVIMCTISDPVEGYYQAGKTQAVIDFSRAYFAAVKQPVDWGFVLDADELLTLENDIGLVEFIACVEGKDKDFIAFHLCNATSSQGNEFTLGTDIYEHFDTVVSCAAPVVIKNAFRVAVNPTITMGNHSLYYSGIQIDRGFVAAEIGARLVHLPYRSRSQVKTKIVNGGSAYEATDLDRNLGAHWRRLYTNFLQTGDEVLTGQMMSYHQRTVREAASQAPFVFR